MATLKSVGELRSRRRKAETAIYDALRELQDDTGLVVENVRLVYERSLANSERVVDVQLDIDLGRGG